MVKFVYGDSVYKGPATVEEVTTELYVKVIQNWDKVDPVLLFCLAFDCASEYSNLLHDNSATTVYAITKCTELFARIGDLTMQVPKHYKDLKLPEDIGALSFGQAMMVRQRAEANDLLDSITFAAACYIWPLSYEDKKFDIKEVNELAVSLRTTGASVVFPIGYFFLMRLQNFGKISKLTLLRQRLAKWVKMWMKRLPNLLGQKHWSNTQT